MSNIPAARKILGEVYDRLTSADLKQEAELIHQALSHLFRKSPVRKMSVKSPPVTKKMQIQIIDLANSTKLHASEIAAIFGINPGRVSEILQRYHRIN